MNSFSIHCETCQQRLNVRDESAVGEILICPKCGSMVLVQRPEDRIERLAVSAAEPPPTVEEAELAEAELDTDVWMHEETQENLEPAAPPVAEEALVPPPQIAEPEPPPESPAPTRPPEAPPSAAVPQVAASAAAMPANAAPMSGRPTKRLHDSADELPETKDDFESPYSGPAALPLPDKTTAEGGVVKRFSDPPQPLAAPHRPEVLAAETSSVAGSETQAGESKTAVAAAAAMESPAADASAASDAAAPDGLPRAASTTWLAEAIRPWRQALLVAAAAMFGVVLAVAVVGWLASQRRNSNPVVNNANGNNSPATATGMEATANGNATKPPVTADPPATEREHPSKLAESPVDPVAIAKPAVAKPAVSNPVPPSKTQTPNPKSQIPNPKNENPSDHPPLLTPADVADPASADALALAKTLEAFGPLVEEKPFDTPPAANSAEPPNGAAKNAAATLPRPEPRTIDLAARLADPIPAIEFADVPLADFLQFISDFSTVPITIDTDALSLVQMTPLTPITVRETNTTVGQVLTKVLQPKLQFVLTDRRLLVTRPPLPAGQLRQLRHPVADLVGRELEPLHDLRDLVRDCVRPESWSTNGGPGSIEGEVPDLVIAQDEITLFATLVFVEKLRVARGLPPQTKFSKSLFAAGYPLAKAAGRLDEPLTVNFLQPTRLGRVLDQIRKDTGLLILVDWESLAPLGWTPDTEVTMSANQTPLREALEKLLEPMELTYRLVDDATLQITTPQAVAARLETAVFAVAPLLSPQLDADGLLARVRKEMGEAQFVEAGGPGVLRLDAPSRSLIAALPQPSLVRLAELLEQWQRAGM